MQGGKSLVEEAFQLYTENLYIAVPMLVAVVVDAVVGALAAAAVYATLMGPVLLQRPGFFIVPFLGVALVLALILALVAVFANTVAGGVVAQLALGIVGGRRLSLGEAWELVKPRAAALVVAAIIAGVVTLVLALVPVIGAALGATLFVPLPVLVVSGRGALEALGESVNIVLDSFSRRAEVPLVVFALFLVGALNSALGILVSLFGYPYAVLLYTLYMRREHII